MKNKSLIENFFWLTWNPQWGDRAQAKAAWTTKWRNYITTLCRCDSLNSPIKRKERLCLNGYSANTLNERV